MEKEQEKRIVTRFTAFCIRACEILVEKCDRRDKGKWSKPFWEKGLKEASADLGEEFSELSIELRDFRRNPTRENYEKVCAEAQDLINLCFIVTEVAHRHLKEQPHEQ